jgi:Ca2+:H+ antiporter
MSTPLSRARVALRVIHRFQAGVRRDVEDGDPEAAAASEAAGEAEDRLLPLLPKLRRESMSQANGEAPASPAPSSARREAARVASATSGELSTMFRTGSGTGFLRSQSRRSDYQASEAHPSTTAPGYFAPVSDAKAISGLILSSWLNVLLLSVPFGFVAQFLNWPAAWRFGLNFLALVPLALLLGEVTEDLAIRFGDVIGGLLNATFGNVVELILSLAALQKGLYDVVAMSLVGSVLSNLLLVLGCCFLVGGTQYHQQSFNAGFNKAMCSLLFLACIALALPTAGATLYSRDKLSEGAILSVSHGTAVMLIFAYGCYLFFQLKTHREVSSSNEEGDDNEDGGEADQETASLSLSGSLAMLTTITVIVAFASEFLTGSIEEVSKGSGINQSFLGLIVLPIAGNACEHITAVFVAAKDKMDLAIGVALGSSIQIAIFVLPFVVLAGWVTGHEFSLALDPLSVVILTLSVIHATFVSSDGTSNWLLGVQLVGTYLLIAILYFFFSA